MESNSSNKNKHRGEVVDIKTRKVIDSGIRDGGLANTPSVRGRGFILSELEKQAMRKANITMDRSSAMPSSPAENAREMSKIDGIAATIISRFGKDPKVQRALNPLLYNINQSSNDDLPIIKNKLSRWNGTEPNPQLYLGLAQWWQNYRGPK